MITKKLLYSTGGGGSGKRGGYTGVQEECLLKCVVVPVTHVAFQTPGLTNSITLFTLPAGAFSFQTRFKPSVAWLGGAITNYYICVGIAGGLQDIMLEYDALPIVPADTEYAEAFAFQSYNHAATITILITARSVGANLDASTQGAGSVEFYYIIKKP